MDDREIIGLFWARAERAIDALKQKYGKLLLKTAMNILCDRRDAEEAENDTYLAVWDAVPPAQPNPLCAYVLKIGRNTSLKLLRSRTAQKRSSYEVCIDELADILPDATLEEQTDARELGRAINRFLGTLDKTSRVLFVKRYWFGDDLTTLSKELGLTQSAASVRLHRIRNKLKDYLQKEGFWL